MGSRQRRDRVVQLVPRRDPGAAVVAMRNVRFRDQCLGEAQLAVVTSGEKGKGRCAIDGRRRSQNAVDMPKRSEFRGAPLAGADMPLGLLSLSVGQLTVDERGHRLERKARSAPHVGQDGRWAGFVASAAAAYLIRRARQAVIFQAVPLRSVMSEASVTTSLNFAHGVEPVDSTSCILL